MVRFHDFKNNNQRCPVCNKNSQRLSYDYVRLEFKKEGYTLLSQEYKSNNTKLKVMCNKNHIYHVKYNNFKNGTRCPLCSCSKGEDKIRFFLLNNNISFIPQKTFKGCKLKHLLPFDFYIPYLNLCIEYDGEQHFNPIDFAGKGEKWAEKQFIKCVERDKIKNQYCKDNNIKLIRIPYWNYKNIEKILNRELKICLKENFND